MRVRIPLPAFIVIYIKTSYVIIHMLCKEKIKHFAQKIGFSEGKTTRSKNKRRFKNDILIASLMGR